MYFRRFYDERLAQASYLLACEATGEAIVVDPSRVIESYLVVAKAEGFRITHVTETHIHADFVSGLRELAAATDARMFVSGCGTPDWQYELRGGANVTVLRDRDHIRVGNVDLEAVHTPGHTPEHLSFLVTDRAQALEPIGIVTGDFVFVGDVGRPDLLEKAAQVANTARAGAQTLYRSLTWFKSLPDHLQIWPGHGAGSACGKGLGVMPQSTVGYERRYNWAFGIENEVDFVDRVLAGQPEPPRYFARMKRVNREGPAVLGRLPEPPSLPDAALAGLLERGALVVDTRPTGEFARGYVPGTINVPLSRSFPTYAGSVLPYDQDLFFILHEVGDKSVAALVESLASIGLDRAAGLLGRGAIEQWVSGGGKLGSIAKVTPAELSARASNGLVVLDVRNSSEWEGGHIAGATLLPLPELLARIDEVPADREIVVHCQGGSRSAIAASLLKAHGRSRVSNLTGGFSAWVIAGGKVSAG